MHSHETSVNLAKRDVAASGCKDIAATAERGETVRVGTFFDDMLLQ
jgi:hypothetical protein